MTKLRKAITAACAIAALGFADVASTAVESEPLTLPGNLQPALKPYMNCLTRDASGRFRSGLGKYATLKEAILADCSSARATAYQHSQTILSQDGQSSDDQKTTLINKTFDDLENSFGDFLNRISR